MSDREIVLERIRTARAAAGPHPERPRGVPSDVVPRAPAPGGDASTAPDIAALLDLLAGRIEDYRARVVRTTPMEAGAAVAGVLEDLGVERVGVARGLAEDRRPPGLTLEDGDALDVPGLDRLDAVLTGCRLAIAETGTLVLDHGPGQGPRRLTLVPDVHVCVVEAEDVVAGVGEAYARLDPARPTTLVSGPSATSDIELQRVEGVHGPRTLVVVLVG